jgi:hypothetical protein
VNRVRIAAPPRTTRFGSPIELSRVHWVEPKLVAEITYLTWAGDGLFAADGLCRAAGRQACERRAKRDRRAIGVAPSLAVLRASARSGSRRQPYRLTALRGPGESYSEVILRLVELEAKRGV